MLQVVNTTIHNCLLGLLLALALLVCGPSAGEAATLASATASPSAGPAPMPRFRAPDPARPAPPARTAVVRFLVDEEFPPFSYRDAGGNPAGFSVALANALCEDMRLSCSFILKPWDRLLPGLAAGEADAVLGGQKITTATLASADVTAAYFRPLGRFVIRTSVPIKTPGLRELAGRRIGVVAGSTHEAWIKTHYPRSVLRSFTDPGAAARALKSGTVDVWFGDAVTQMYWLAGKESEGCCRFLGGAYSDPDGFSPGMTIAVRRGDSDLRDLLDAGLDRLELSGTTGALLRRYLPMGLW